MPCKKPTGKRAPKPLPSVEYLHQRLRYHPETGVLQWKERPAWHFAIERIWLTWNTRFAWTEAGVIDSTGHRTVMIDGVRYRAHRIIYKIVTGEEPLTTIDHKDGNPDNNALANLRSADMSQQMFNTSMHKDNSCGHKGVHRCSDREKWMAEIMIGGVRRRRRFDTRDEASMQYVAWARELHGEFYRGE
jgi:hypothetical protein